MDGNQTEGRRAGHLDQFRKIIIDELKTPGDHLRTLTIRCEVCHEIRLQQLGALLHFESLISFQSGGKYHHPLGAGYRDLQL